MYKVFGVVGLWRVREMRQGQVMANSAPVTKDLGNIPAGAYLEGNKQG